LVDKEINLEMVFAYVMKGTMMMAEKIKIVRIVIIGVLIVLQSLFVLLVLVRIEMISVMVFAIVILDILMMGKIIKIVYNVIINVILA
jgi:hypothetical protein